MERRNVSADRCGRAAIPNSFDCSGTIRAGTAARFKQDSGAPSVSSGSTDLAPKGKAISTSPRRLGKPDLDGVNPTPGIRKPGIVRVVLCKSMFGGISRWDISR